MSCSSQRANRIIPLLSLLHYASNAPHRCETTMADVADPPEDKPVAGLFDSVSAAMWRFLEKGKYVDIVVELQDGRYACHRVVLAALSPVFDAMLSDNMREHQEGLIRLPSVNLATWKAIMGFYYASQKTINEYNIEELLDVSEMFQLDSLKEGCLDFMRATISSENSLYYLQLADKYSLHRIRVRAYHFVMTQFSKVCKESDFIQLCEVDVLALVRSSQLNVESEEVVSDAILQWLVVKDADIELATRMFAEIRLCQLSTEYLQEKILTHVYVRDNPVNCGLVQKELSQRPPYDRSKIPVKPCVRRGKPCHREEVIYVAGADGDRQFALYAWSLAKRVWIRLPDPCHYHGGLFATVVSNNVLYLTGGSLLPHTSLAFDPTKRSWTQVSRLVEGRQEHGMAAVDGTLYTFGGYALGKGALASIECLTPQPGARVFREVVEVERSDPDEKKHADKKGRRGRKRRKDKQKGGGCHESSMELGVVNQGSSFVDGEWQPAGRLVLGVWDCGVAVLRDVVFVVGGDHTSGGMFEDRFDIIQTFHTRTHACSMLHLHLPCPMRRARCITAESQDTIFILGSTGDLVTLTLNPEYSSGSVDPSSSRRGMRVELTASTASNTSSPAPRTSQGRQMGSVFMERMKQATSFDHIHPSEAGASGDAEEPELGGTSSYVDLVAEGSRCISRNIEDDLPCGADAKMFACKRAVGSGAFEEPSDFLKTLKEIFPDPQLPKSPSLHAFSHTSSDDDFALIERVQPVLAIADSTSSLSSGDFATRDDPVMVKCKMHIETLDKLATHDVFHEGDCLTVFASQSRVDVNLVSAISEFGADLPAWDREIPPPPIRLSVHGVGKLHLPWKHMV